MKTIPTERPRQRPGTRRHSEAHHETCIRGAISDDIDFITDLTLEGMDGYTAGSANFTKTPYGHIPLAGFILQHIVSKGSRAWVAENNGQIVAYCLAAITRNPPMYGEQQYGAIYDLAVSGHFRRQGIGRSMVQQVSTWFHQRQVQNVEIRMARPNEAARIFWSRMGLTSHPKGAHIVQIFAQNI